MADFKNGMTAVQFVKDLLHPPRHPSDYIYKASDAFAPYADKGIVVGVTQADRTIAQPSGRLKGGPLFSMLGEVDPAYKGKTWGFDSSGHAQGMLNGFEAQPADTMLMTTILGGPLMQGSNSEIFKRTSKAYRDAIANNKLLPDHLRKTNELVQKMTDKKGGVNLFDPDSDVTDPAFWKGLSTFQQRRAMNDIMGGYGVGGPKSGGAIFDWQKIMDKTTEPMLRDVPTRSVGPRIWTLDGGKEYSPHLNKAYPDIVTGVDQNINFNPVPYQDFLKDFTDNFMQTKNRVPNWKNLTMGHPKTQEITDQWLQHLKNQGYKDGGAISPPAASMDGEQFMLAAAKAGIPTDIGSLNKIVDLVNKGLSIDEAIEALTNPMRKRDGGQVQHFDLGGGAKKDADIMGLKKPTADTSFARVDSLLADIGRNRDEYEKIAKGAEFNPKLFSNENMYAIRLLQAANATPDPERYLESLNPYHGSQLQFDLSNPKSNLLGYVDKSEPNKAVILNMKGADNLIPHELTHTLQWGKGKNINPELNRQTMRRAQELPIEVQKAMMPSGNRFQNMKEVWANVAARAHEVNAAGGDFINSPEGQRLFPTNTEKRDYYTNAMPSVNSITPDTGTFVPNNQTLLQRIVRNAKREIGLADGGQVEHMQAGGVKKGLGVLEDVANSLLKPKPALSPYQLANQKASLFGQSADPYARSLQQGFEHGWSHGTTGDITSFDRALLGETTGANSAKKGFFFARDPQNPPEHLKYKSNDPQTIKMLRKAGVDVDEYNKVSFEGHGADTASGYSVLGGDREYKEALRKAKAAETRGDWDEQEKWSQIAEDHEISRMNRDQGLVAKHNDARDVMLDKIQRGFYDPMAGKSQAELSAFDRQYEKMFPANWWNSPFSQQLSSIKSNVTNHLGETNAAPVLDAIKQFELARNERMLAENIQSGSNVIPAALRYKNPLVHDFQGNTYRDQTYSDLVDQALKNNHDALILKNTYDPGAGTSKLIDVGVVFDPKNIRSKFAAFDPEHIDSADISKAEGGRVEHMQAGGVKKAFGALTQLEKEANLARYLEQSVVKDRLYHGTGRDITSFRPNLESGATFLTPSPAFANKFAMDDLLYDSNSAYRGAPSGANVMPVYAQVKNPWDYENPKHIEAVAKTLDPQDRKAFRKQAPTGNWLAIEDHYPSIQQAGFDAAHVMEGGVKNLGVFNQKAIKSALGNRGTYDVTDPDITKAEGGKVEHMQAGGIMPRAGIYYPTSGDERSQAAGLPADFYRKGMTDVASHGYHAGVDVPAGDARLTADLMGSRYVSPQMTRDAINALRLGAEFPVGEGRLRAELMKGLAPNVPTNVGLRYSRPFAEGGSVEHMQAGGMMGLVNEFKALQAAHNAARLAKTTRNIPPVQDMVISQAEKEANLARYLENAAVKDRMYHATGDDFSVVDVDKSDPRSKFGTGFYMTPNTNYANFFANMRMKEGKPSQVMPVYTSVKNPYEISGTQNIPLTGIDREKLKALGHDGVLFRNDAGNVQEVVAFDPTQVKSAIGNRGTFDPTEVELTKAEGGAVHLQMGGMTPEPAGGSARQETFAAQHMEEGGDIMRRLFDHALDKGDIHEMTHAMLVKQHEAEHG